MSRHAVAAGRTWWLVALVLTLNAAAWDLSPALVPPATAIGFWVLLGSGLVRRTRARGPWVVLRAMGDGLLAALAFLAACGLWAQLGYIGLVLFVALVACSPPVLRLLAERRPVPEASSDRVAAGTAGPSFSMVSRHPRVSSMSTPALGEVWAMSGRALPEADDSTDSLALVELRQRLLDELQRRDAAALREWLQSEPSPASDPTRYFSR